MKKTEEEFAKMIEGAELSEQEIDVLREDVGLPPKNKPDYSAPVYRKRLQLSAWSKLRPQGPVEEGTDDMAALDCIK